MASTPKETVTKTEPYDGAKPYINKMYAKMDKAISDGKPQYYTGKTEIDNSAATLDSEKWVEQIARQGSPLVTNAQNTANNIMSGSAFNPAGTNTLAAGTQWQNGATGMQQHLSQYLMGANNPANSMLEQTANGSMLNSNPYLNTAIQNANQGLVDQFKTITSPNLASQASLAGRTGSGAAAAIRNDAESTLANAMSKNANDMMMANYQQERSNQLNAQNSMGANYNSDIANMRGSLSDYANTSSGNNAAQMNAANSLINAQNTQMQTQLGAAGMAGDLRNLDYADAERLAGVGAQQDARADVALQNAMTKWDADQNKDMNTAANFVSVLTTGGYNNQTKPVYTNTAAQALGGLSTLASILPMLCDERTKNIGKYIGRMPNGMKMYEFTYKDDPDATQYVGPIAQEVRETHPESVIEVNDTLMVIPSMFKEAA